MGGDVGEGDAEEAHAFAEFGEGFVEKLGAACLKYQTRRLGRHIVTESAPGVYYALRLQFLKRLEYSAVVDSKLHRQLLD